MIKFKVVPLGAAKIVTGSSYWVKVLEDEEVVLQFIVDHGLFQGPEVEALNNQEYPFNPADIQFLILTHAHADHSARIPLLIRRGFRGKIYSTRKTAELTELILRDSAKIQEMDQEIKGKPALYNLTDVENTLPLFVTSPSNELLHLPKYSNLSVYLRTVGHIIGAVTVEINYRGKMLVFSGDIGRPKYEFINSYSPTTEKRPDFIFMESLYGGKFHPDTEQMEDDFAKIITKTFQRDGNVIIPAFAIQRTQQLLLTLKRLIAEGKVTREVNIYLDSRLASAVTDIYTNSPYEIKNFTENMFDFTNVHKVKGRKAFRKVLQQPNTIVIAGSGMCNGGKILNYLKVGLGNTQDSVIIVGFQAEGTLGRELLSGNKRVMIDKEFYNVKAEIAYIPGFSAHGDQNDLLGWLRSYQKENLKKVFLVHSELEQASAFQDVLHNQGYETAIPTIFEEILCE